MIDFSNISDYIFDFGGVLYNIEHYRTLNAFAKLSTNPNRIRNLDLSNYQQNPTLIEYEKGLIETDVFRNKIKYDFNIECDDIQFNQAWNETLIGLFDDSIGISKEFKCFGRIYILSNTSSLHFDLFSEQTNELFQLFDGLYFSHLTHHRKPDRDAFENITQKEGIIPEKALFIDDSEVNILSAKNLGFKTFLINNKNNLSDLLHTVKLHAQNFHL